MRLIPATPEGQTDRILSAREVAERIGCGKDWVYEHIDELPFKWRQGKIWRFSEAGLETWLAQRRAV
jgi:excisionase family DNA binding protein